jgi:hypothetical protein
MTWALVFLTNPLCNLFNKKLDSAAVLADLGKKKKQPTWLGFPALERPRTNELWCCVYIQY